MLDMDGLYTFVLQIGEASSVSQARGENVVASIRNWLADLQQCVTIVSPFELQQLRDSLAGDVPQALDGPINVWYVNTTIDSGHAQIHIIKTSAY